MDKPEHKSLLQYVEAVNLPMIDTEGLIEGISERNLYRIKKSLDLPAESKRKTL